MTASETQYEIIASGNYTTLKLVGHLQIGAAKEFEASLSSLAKPTQDVIVQCDQVLEMEKAWIRALVQLVSSLKDINKQIIFVGVSSDLRIFFKEQGVDGAFKCAPTLGSALGELGLAKKKIIDMDFINPFITATLNVLEVQGKIKGIAGAPAVKKPGERFFGDVSGMIGIASDYFNGDVVVSLPERTYLSLIQEMFGMKFDRVDRENVSGAGEIANIIFGKAKAELNEKGYSINKALPSVVFGRDETVSIYTLKGIGIVVPFDSSEGNFWIEICRHEDTNP